MRLLLSLVLLSLPLVSFAGAAEEEKTLFEREVAPILERRCLSCHNGEQLKGGFSLETAESAMDSGYIIAGDVELSYLVEMIAPADGKPKMPKDSDPLKAKEVAAIKKWIAAGAHWPAERKLTAAKVTDTDWWSLRPLKKPELPKLSAADQAWVRAPIDAFVIAKLREKGLAPSPEADRRTLIRRVYYDLTGLPPSFEQIEAFAASKDPRAYEKIVQRLLASPGYGERWARHWLDVAHYGDTHGYDKDKVRPHAWPYRDYVIRAFNEDKPYRRFVREQLAGDALYPHTRDGVVATGFIAAGPFDFVGQIEVGEGTESKKVVRNLDRDDMVATTMNVFVSMTAQCARCHNHKFDPITQEDYYSLQAVFAGVDRANRPYEPDPDTAQRRLALNQKQAALAAKQAALAKRIKQLAGPELAALDRRLAALNEKDRPAKRPEFGYHSQLAPHADTVKWVQVDLGRPTEIATIVYVGCHDDFAGIGAGFGFPVRYKIEISNDPAFKKDVTVVVDHTAADTPNPGTAPQSVALSGKTARYVRFTATRLAERSNDFNFALAELSVLTPEGVNAAAGAPVTALDSIEAPIRWAKANLVDGVHYGGRAAALAEIVELNAKRQALLERTLNDEIHAEQAALAAEVARVKADLAALPPRKMVYAAATHFQPQGNFRPTRGEPRPIYLLHRGGVNNPKYEVGPGTISAIEWLDSRFERTAAGDESERRIALANWIVDPRNPLTWRSIVNRVWHYHFGRGIVDSPNDFGRMGSLPTHPQLLDWLAADFRDGGQSLKDLHRLIVTSATYRQSSRSNAEFAKIDGGNQYLWRMNRARLDAEAIRDTVLLLAGKLRREMGGPGFRAFGFKDDHSPHYKYHEHDPDNPAAHRRSIYRFIVRSVPDPFMETLDCADPSQVVAKRNETLTALQALALMNNKFMVRMAGHFAERVEKLGDDPAARLNAAYRLALGRDARAEELAALVPYAQEHGLANACRLILNTNEFIFID